ncbi:MAG: ARMT1-like domain-containing protein [Lentisphaeria bacterium]
MQTYLECMTCFVRQTLDAARHVTDDEKAQEEVLRAALKELSEIDMSAPPPVMAQHIHRFIRSRFDLPDPYRTEKKLSNNRALQLMPQLIEKVKNSDVRLETAVRLAIAGNIIDLGVKSQVHEEDINGAVEHALNTKFDGDVQALENALAEADSILYLADNAGEIVFDRLLLEQLPREKLTVAVKGSPIINDALREDAEQAGITQAFRVIDNGSDAPGTALAACSPEFLEEYEKADLIISKGQGNYETLSHENKNIFFLLKVKCPVISRDVGREIGALVLTRAEGKPVG